jgi:predicted nuclease with TOPRIM domain
MYLKVCNFIAQYKSPPLMKYVKENWLTIVLVIAVVIVGYKGLFNTGNQDLKYKLKELQKKNDSLIECNAQIENEIGQLNFQYQKADIVIEHLQKVDSMNSISLKAINTKLTTLKPQYEKVQTFANSFTSNEITSYFADSIGR